MVDREMVEQYVSSLIPIKSMLRGGLITQDEFMKAESHLAEKYCIKKVSIYRGNDLTNFRERAIYSTVKEA